MSVYDFTVKMPGGEAEAMAAHAGKVLLVVNTASNVASRRNIRDLRRSFANIRIKVSKSLHFRATNLVRRNPAMKKKSRTSARSLMMCHFLLLPKLMSTARTRIPYGII